MQQFCITASKYGGLYRAFCDMCSTQYFFENPGPTSVKIKKNDILRCKLWTQSKHVKIYDNLRISLTEALFSIKLGTRPLFFILIRPVSWHFCDGIKLSDSCRSRCEYTHTEKHLASCATCKTGIGHYRYALVNILIESDFVIFNRRIFVTKNIVSNIITNG